MTAADNAQKDTAQQQFGTASALLTGLEITCKSQIVTAMILGLEISL